MKLQQTLGREVLFISHLFLVIYASSNYLVFFRLVIGLKMYSSLTLKRLQQFFTRYRLIYSSFPLLFWIIKMSDFFFTSMSILPAHLSIKSMDLDIFASPSHIVARSSPYATGLRPASLSDSIRTLI